MIVVSHPDRSDERRIAIGYWSNMQKGMGTTRAALEIVSCLIKRQVLPHPSNFVDEEWDKEEKKMVADYLNKAGTLIKWKGFSTCRMCDKRNGTTCVGDDRFIWPKGFAHYIEEHNVRPPREFVDHVRAQMCKDV